MHITRIMSRYNKPSKMTMTEQQKTVYKTYKQIKNKRTMEVKITNENFESLKNGEQPLVVDFWATWCGPCRMLAPVLEQLEAERPDVRVCKVNIDEETELARRFGVMSIPTVILFQNGQEKNRSVGLVPKERLLMLLD